MLKLTYIYHAQPAQLAFQALKSYPPKTNLTIRFGFRIIQSFTIQEMAFRLCFKESMGGKSQEGKQLKFAPRLDKFAQWKLALRNLMLFDIFLDFFYPSYDGFSVVTVLGSWRTFSFSNNFLVVKNSRPCHQSGKTAN